MINYLSFSCNAAPATGLLSKRGPIWCQPIDPGQQLEFEDCLVAYDRILDGVVNLTEVISFGPGPNVNVPMGWQPMTWEHGTFVATA